MAWPFRGNINGTVNSSAQNLPMLIENFALVNKSGGTIGVNVYLINNDAAQINLTPLNLQLDTGEMYEGTRQIVMLASEIVRVQTSGSCDYDFLISNTKPEL